MNNRIEEVRRDVWLQRAKHIPEKEIFDFIAERGEHDAAAIKSAAGMFAVGSIGIDDVSWLLGWKPESLPEEFFLHAERVYKEYEEYLKKQEKC